MENRLQVFENNEFGKVRVLHKDGEPWFVAKDVAEILGYSETSKMLRRLDEDEKADRPIWANSQNRTMTVTNESGLYNAIIGSKLPGANKFRKWVTSEVLPSIRKHGAYMTENTIEKALADPDFLIQLATQLKDEKQKRLLAEQKIEEQKPLVSFAETCLESKDSILVRELAKIISKEGIKIGQNRLYDKLREWGLIMKYNTEPYQTAIDAGYFIIKEVPKTTPYGIILTKTTRVLPKGQVYIVERLKREQI